MKGCLVLFVPDYLTDSKSGKLRKATAHLLIGWSPETWPLIRCSSGCRRRDNSWKTKSSSSWPGTCQHTPKAATSPALPQSWSERWRKRGVYFLRSLWRFSTGTSGKKTSITSLPQNQSPVSSAGIWFLQTHAKGNNKETNDASHLRADKLN